MCGCAESTLKKTMYLDLAERPKVEVGDVATFTVRGKVSQVTEREHERDGETHYECSVTVEEPEVKLGKKSSPSRPAYGAGSVGSKEKE
jgi:hypothetical protein